MICCAQFEVPFGWFYGIVVGFIFGFLAQKARISRANVIIGQFLLRDFTVFKVVFTAIIIGGIGIYAMWDVHVLPILILEPGNLIASAVGGSMLGIGMTLLGYCPGTVLAACGEGARDARFGIFGLIVGAVLYKFIEPFIRPFLMADDYSGSTFPVIYGISPWLIFTGLAIGALILFYLLERFKK